MQSPITELQDRLGSSAEWEAGPLQRSEPLTISDLFTFELFIGYADTFILGAKLMIDPIIETPGIIDYHRASDGQGVLRFQSVSIQRWAMK